MTLKTLFKDNSAAPKYEFITILNLTTILQTTALYQFVSKNNNHVKYYFTHILTIYFHRSYLNHYSKHFTGM